MEISYKYLNDTDISIIHQTMIEAFSDYQIDMTYMTLERFIKRAVLGRVDFSKSVGAFSGNKLVGFTLIGIDNYKGNLSAFDTVTGIIKDFRGKGIAGKIFDTALPKLKNAGVKKFYLEVLQENKAAIRAYEKTGFKFEREYHCYISKISKLNIKPEKFSEAEIKSLNPDELSEYTHFSFQHPAWESNLSAIKQVGSEIIIYGVFIKNKCIGVISYYPTLEWIMNFGVADSYKEKGLKLFLLNILIEKIRDSHTIIKMGNLEPGNPLNKFFLDQGFELYAKQFEMVFDLE